MGGSPVSQEAAIRCVLDILPGCRQPPRDEWELLGAPLSCESGARLLRSKLAVLDSLCSRLTDLTAQEALIVLRSSLFAPRLTYLLRCMDAAAHADILSEIDSFLRGQLCKTLNISLDDRAFAKATLPLRLGGLGVRTSSSLVSPCWVSSLHASKDLARFLLPARLRESFSEFVSRIGSSFSALWRPEELEQLDLSSQSQLDSLGCSRLSASLLESCATNDERAAFRASQEPLARGWLTVLPIPHVGTVLDDASFRIGVCLRLGVAPCIADRCSRCSRDVGPEGTHGLHCPRSAGRHARHSEVNDIIFRSLNSAHIPSRREPTGLYSTQTRPDGLTLVPWRLGKCLVWDATVVDTLAPSHVARTCSLSGAAAADAEDLKRSKYVGNLPTTYEFIPLGFETLGAMGPAAQEFVETLGKRLRATTGCERAGEYLRQRLSLAILRGNVGSILGSLSVEDTPGVDFDGGLLPFSIDH